VGRVVPDRLPRKRLALDRERLPVPAAHDADVEPHVCVRIRVLHDLKLPAVIVRIAYFDGQLLTEFPTKRVHDGFPRLHLAAWKLPRAGAWLSCGPRVQQKPAIRSEQDADGHRDG